MLGKRSSPRRSAAPVPVGAFAHRDIASREAEGKQIKAPPAERGPAKVVNLMDALKASLASAKKPTSGTAQGERRATAHAAKSAGKKRRRASA